MRNERALIQIVGIQSIDLGDASFLQLVQQGFGDFFIRIGDDLATVFIHHIGSQHTTDQEVLRHTEFLDVIFLHLADMTHRDALVLGHDDLARFIKYIKACHITAQAFGDNLELNPFLAQMERIELEEHLEDLFVGIT